VGEGLFDVDRHGIPERKGEAAHGHFDLRFMIEADETEGLVRAAHESKELAWVEVAAVTTLNAEESMARMVRKTQAGRERGRGLRGEAGSGGIFLPQITRRVRMGTVGLAWGNESDLDGIF